MSLLSTVSFVHNVMHAFKWMRVNGKWKKESMCAMSRTSERHQPRGKRKTRRKKLNCAVRRWAVVVRSKRDFYGIISYGLKWFMIRVELVAAITTHYEHFKPPSQLCRRVPSSVAFIGTQILAYKTYNSIHLRCECVCFNDCPSMWMLEEGDVVHCSGTIAHTMCMERPDQE